jgi:aspartate aminotransferase
MTARSLHHMLLKRTLAHLSKGPSASASVAAASSSVPVHNIFSNVPRAPADPILGITTGFTLETNPNKINLSVGAYRDSQGKPWILPSVKQAYTLLHESNKEYTSIAGSQNFQRLVRNFLYGSFKDGADFISKDSISIAQTLSGTGSLKITAEFLKKWMGINDIYISNPTWANHLNIFTGSGVTPHYYSYFNASTNTINHEALIYDLKHAKTGSAVLLHACCHNPTGLDPTAQQWEEIIDVVIKSKLIPVVDLAYQGFESGSLSQDLHLLELVSSKIKEGLIPTMFLCQSFAKNMGLYGERIGSLSIITPNSETRENVDSQLQRIIRSIYSSPPIHGSKLVEVVLSNENIFKQWEEDVLVMSHRIKDMRVSLFEKLKNKGHVWDHLIKQNGMFCYTGLTKEQVLKLRDNFAIYCTLDGRFSISGVNEGNVDYLAESIDHVLRQ